MIEPNNSEPVQSFRELFLVLIGLFCLTAITVMVSRLNTGSARILVALSIASLKTSLVLLFFMHIRRAGKAVVLAFITTVVVLATFIGLTFFDVAFR